MIASDLYILIQWIYIKLQWNIGWTNSQMLFRYCMILIIHENIKIVKKEKKMTSLLGGGHCV
jgi:hypothetical protein